MAAPCLPDIFMVIKCIRRRIDVFRYSGNIVVGNHNSGNLVFAQNSQQRSGTETGCAQAGDCDLRKNAIGRRGLCNLASGGGSFPATMETGSFPLPLSRHRPGSADLDNLLGVHRISEKMTGYPIAIAGRWMLDYRYCFVTRSSVPNTAIHNSHSDIIRCFLSNRSLLQLRAYRRLYP